MSSHALNKITHTNHCVSYNNSYTDYIFSSYYSLFSKYCVSLDILSLTFVIIIRICYCFFLFYLLKSVTLVNEQIHSITENTILLVLFVNCFSLLIALSKTPQFNERTNTKETSEIKNII